MIYRRPPQSLKEVAFVSWLAALDAGTSDPSLAPLLFLTRALEGGAKLKDATLVRVAQEAASAGVEELVFNYELLHPFLFLGLIQALAIQSSNLRKVVLKISSRITYEDSMDLLLEALKGMINLEEVSIVEGANDTLLKALAVAQPPLKNVDFSYSSKVTDEGLKALLTPSGENFRPELTEKGAFRNLQNLNIWGTGVTTKGCILVLRYCHDLVSLMCQWTAEALALLELKQSNPVRLEQLFINNEELFGNFFKAITNLCPCLKILSIRQPKDKALSLVNFLEKLPTLEEFSLLQFYPLYYSHLKLPHMERLRILHVSSLCSATINLDLLVNSCPQLTHLTLEGITPEGNKDAKPINSLTNESSATDDEGSFKYLKELRILSGCKLDFRPLEPSLIVVVLNGMIRNAQFIHLDDCQQFQDDHFLSLIEGGSLLKVENMRLARAFNMSDDVIHALTRSCPRLKRLVLTKLSFEREEQLHLLKVHLKENNVNLKLETFTYFSHSLGIDKDQSKIDTT